MGPKQVILYSNGTFVNILQLLQDFINAEICGMISASSNIIAVN